MRKACAAALVALLGAAVAHASEVKIFRQQSQSSFVRGTIEGLSVDELGTLRLAPRAEKLVALSEPFVLAAARHPEGWVVGTGNSGKVLLVRKDGTVRQLFATGEPEVFAITVDSKGVVWAGSSPNGKIYRYENGDTKVWYDPKQTYIWQIVPGDRGELFVATGTDGKLFRVTAQGKGDVLWKGDDTHVRSLLRLPGGDLLAGTAGTGRIVRITPGGKARTLFDAVEPEVVALAAGENGSVWAAAVASEASQIPATPAPAPQPAKGEKPKEGSGSAEADAAAGDATVVVTASGGAGQPVGSRPPGFGGPHSEIFRLDTTTSGAETVTPVARLQDDTVQSLLWRDGRLWIGTGVDGKLYSLRGTDLVLEGNLEERQIMALLPGSPDSAGGNELALATTNAAAIYRTHSDSREGTYTSPVLDAQQISRFGTFRWMGEAPRGTSVKLAFRSGISAEPDASWSKWSEASEANGNDRELSLAAVPAGRYFQWRATVSASGAAPSPQIASAEISYLQSNLAPRITQLTALDPGQILVPFNFNPTSQTYEPVHPNREGIFTTVEPATDSADDRLKTLWKQGYRTLRWKAEDPNSDPLSYTLTFRREPAAGSDPQAEAVIGSDGDAGRMKGTDGGWMPMVDDLSDTYYSFDETSLPDGVYRFRLQASDEPRERPAAADQPPESAAPSAPEQDQPALTDTRISEPVVVDHSPPRLVGVHRDGELLRVEVEDAWNPLRSAEYSIGAAAWTPAQPADGLLDGRREILLVHAPKPKTGQPPSLVILRVMDAAFNGITFDLSAEAAR